MTVIHRHLEILKTTICTNSKQKVLNNIFLIGKVYIYDKWNQSAEGSVNMQAFNSHTFDLFHEWDPLSLPIFRLQIWKLSDGSVLKEVSHTEKVTCLKCSKDSQFLVTGSQDRSVKVWELESGKIVQVIRFFKFYKYLFFINVISL